MINPAYKLMFMPCFIKHHEKIWFSYFTKKVEIETPFLFLLGMIIGWSQSWKYK